MTKIFKNHSIWSPATSVTRFGKVLTLWKRLKSLGHFMRAGFVPTGQSFEPTFALFYYLEQFLVLLMIKN